MNEINLKKKTNRFVEKSFSQLPNKCLQLGNIHHDSFVDMKLDLDNESASAATTDLYTVCKLTKIKWRPKKQVESSTSLLKDILKRNLTVITTNSRQIVRQMLQLKDNTSYCSQNSLNSSCSIEKTARLKKGSSFKVSKLWLFILEST